MKYIRTKDGRIHKLHAYQSFENLFVCESQKALPYDLGGDLIYRVRKSNVVKQTDTIEELCDGYVVESDDGWYGFKIINFAKQDYYIRERHQEQNITLYGFIKTDKGLIYVAKMNNKGELELL